MLFVLNAMFTEFCYEFCLRADIHECDPFCSGLCYCGGGVVLCCRIGNYCLNGFVKYFHVIVVVYQDLFYGVVFFFFVHVIEWICCYVG